MKKHTLHTIQDLKKKNQPIVVLTAYDSSFSQLLSKSGVDIILVGDSLGMVMQGNQSTVPVTMEQMIYHTKCVAKTNTHCWLIADYPFMSYATEEQALENGSKLMQAGANMVKLEGGQWLLPTTAKLAERGVPVCAHLGLTPQSVDALGGFKVQGREKESADQLMKDAIAVEKSGASLLVLECVPSQLAKEISAKLTIPTIGIGAGIDTDGQVLVLQDMLGINTEFNPKFVKNFFDDEDVNSVSEAISAYCDAVRNRSFPEKKHCFE
ncbi:MAG: 3-methyl-2-oxobutanoate hydroxymethyltransferase [Kangiellaceae bacterium]|nr:3-methyl-2-oxobutanoate hydroxymethyltransferase [Kangiellaceae bacterium]